MNIPENEYMGDPRRCQKHPEVKTSSPDGLHDTPCGKCESSEDMVWCPIQRLEQFAYNRQQDGTWAMFAEASSLSWPVGAAPEKFMAVGKNVAFFSLAETQRNSEGESYCWIYRSATAKNVTVTVWNG